MTQAPTPILVLQYGNFDLTGACFESLRKQTVPVKIVLIDGNSPGKSQEILDELSAKADVSIILNENLGYAGANNVAIRKVLEEGDQFFMVVNNDTILQPDCLEQLLAVMNSDPEVAQVCPKVKYADGSLQSVGGTIREDIFEPQLIGRLEDEKNFATEAEVVFAPGMAVLIRSKAVQEAGALAEEYFMYGEDVDWSLAFAKAGWKIKYAPKASLIHFESASSGSFSRFKGFYLTRSNVILAKKWLKTSDFARFKKKFIWKLCRQTIKYAGHPAYVAGMWDGLRKGL